MALVGQQDARLEDLALEIRFRGGESLPYRWGSTATGGRGFTMEDQSAVGIRL